MLGTSRSIRNGFIATLFFFLFGIFYMSQYDLNRECFLIETPGKPHVHLTGPPKIMYHRRLDLRTIWTFLHQGGENVGGGEGDERGLVAYKDSSKKVASAKNSVAQNVSSPDGRHQCFKQVHIWGNEERPHGKETCPGLPCGINLVIDTSYHTLKTSDAVLLLHRTNWKWSDLMSHRPEGQKWIFQSHESPINTRRDIVPPKENYQNAYDYVMSYRFRESHLYGRFGYYDPSKPSVGSNDTKNWAEGRTRQVAWLSSNCNTTYLKWNRTGFVREMAKLLDVGMYGKCGDAKACPGRQINGPMTCTGVLRQFKFYLALENGACRDYISEKFWHNSILQDIVPIVFGPPRSDYEAVAPPNSFIHVQDFETIQDLADYVNLLDKNDTLYNKYFEWKKVGFAAATFEDWLFEPRQMCQVVKRLLFDEKEAKAGTLQRPDVPDWAAWWTNSCRKLDINGFPIKIHK